MKQRTVHGLVSLLCTMSTAGLIYTTAYTLLETEAMDSTPVLIVEQEDHKEKVNLSYLLGLGYANLAGALAFMAKDQYDRMRDRK
jgi:hypothetical protein